jgi:hypothetical protein
VGEAEADLAVFLTRTPLSATSRPRRWS